MIAEIFLDPKSDVNNEIAKFKNSVLEKLKEKGINDCTILCKEQDEKIHVIAISYVNKNQEENNYTQDGFKLINNSSSKVASIDPNTVSFNFKKIKD